MKAEQTAERQGDDICRHRILAARRRELHHHVDE